MKKNIFVFYLIFFLFHNCTDPQPPFQFGTYYGYLPCADCPGINYELTLKEDFTYLEKMLYAERGNKIFTHQGSYEQKDGKIHLKGKSEGSGMIQLAIEGDQFKILDIAGEPFSSGFSERYLISQTKPETFSMEIPTKKEKKQTGGFKAVGNEPMWVLEIDFAKQMKLRTLDGHELELVTPIPDPVQALELNAVNYTAETEGGTLQVTIFKQSCQDNMSGEDFSYKVQVNAKTSAMDELVTYKGCGKYLEEKVDPIPVIFDTDANNELDDQHALAYLLFNGPTFDVRGVTVNATHSGGEIKGHYEEAERVLQLCNLNGKIPLYTGANADFEDIRSTLDQPKYDGHAAVDFMIKEARKSRNQKLVLLPVGKLTNIALALEKAPDIIDKVRIVWLGSNYPEPGEYNQENDLASLNYILDVEVPFEMVIVRYGKSSGTDAVRVTPTDMEQRMPGKGPRSEPVTGRHGGSFTHFGDYSINLFSHIDLHGDPPARALFDMVAVAILKNPSWGEQLELPAPILDGENWKDRPGNSRKIIIWENFAKEAILEDFFAVMHEPVLAKRW